LGGRGDGIVPFRFAWDALRCVKPFRSAGSLRQLRQRVLAHFAWASRTSEAEQRFKADDAFRTGSCIVSTTSAALTQFWLTALWLG